MGRVSKSLKRVQSVHEGSGFGSSVQPHEAMGTRAYDLHLCLQFY